MAPYKLEARDLTFSLSVRPRQSNCCPDGGFVLRDAAGERGNETGAGSLDPWRQRSYGFAPDHRVEFGDDLAGLDKGGDASFDGRDGDGLRLRKSVPSD